MKQGYSIGKRLLSIILLIGILTGTTAFSVLAKEAAEEIRTIAETVKLSETKSEHVSEGAAIDYIELDEALEEELEEIEEAEEPGPIEMNPHGLDLKSLIFRLKEYDSFTEEEKAAVLAFFHMETDPEQKKQAEEQEARMQEYLDSLPEPRRSEAKIANMTEKGKNFSALSKAEKAVITGYLHRNEKELAPMFAALEAQGYTLFDCVLIAEITEDDLFTVEEAVTLYELYDERPERDQNIIGFQAFARSFEQEESGRLETRQMSAAQIKAEGLRKSKAAYISAEALENAKQLLLAGYTAKEIRAAYSVAATYDLNPMDLICSEEDRTAVSAKGEERAFLNVYPVALRSVKTELISKQASLLGETKLQSESAGSIGSVSSTGKADTIDYAAATEQVYSVASALYGTGGAKLPKDPVPENVQQPFDAQMSEREYVTLNTGALNYTETILSVPGINHGAMELKINYDSAESSLQQYGYIKEEHTGYNCIYTVRIYANLYSRDELVSETVYLEEFYTQEEALARQAELEGVIFSCTIDPPILDEYYASMTFYNTVTWTWVDNPMETISETHDSPAPTEPIDVSEGGYTGTLYRGEAYIDEDLGTECVGEYAPGRMIYETKNRWAVEFSGYLSKEVSDGAGGYFDVMVVDEESVWYCDSTEEETYNEKRFDIGSGWTFNIPSIDTVSQSQRLILPGIGTYTVEGNTILEYSREDMTLSSYSGYGNGQFTSSKKLTFADGSVYYFNEDGLCMAMADRFGNTVTLKYVQIVDNWYLSEIIDADGESTSIEYVNMLEGKQIIVTAPDGVETVLETKILASEQYGSDNYVLERIVYGDGESATFDYTIRGGEYSFIDATAGNDIQYALLNRVAYGTGAELRYAYEAEDVSLGEGYLTVYRLSERYALENGSDANMSGYTTYAYTGDYTGEEAYETEMIEKDGENVRSVKYIFDTNHLCICKEVYDGDTLLQKTETEYDKYQLPSEVVNINYGSQTMMRTELYSHDRYGNRLSYLSPKGEGNLNNTDYLTSYTYDGSYQLMLSAEYKQDEGTTVRKVNVLTADKKNIAETLVYVNNSLKSKTAYTYSGAGRVLTKTEYPALIQMNKSIVTTYTYDGSKLISETITGMKDVEGAAQPDLTQSYTYDEMGRVLSATDRNGGVTETVYDERGRVVMVTNPDGSRTEYTYDLGSNTTTVEQSERTAYTADYDGLGRRQAVYYASGELQKEYYYDERGRLLAESTGQGSSASGTVYYTYDALDRVTEKAVYNTAGDRQYRESYVYDNAYTSEMSMVQKTVPGSTGAASIVTKSYTNKYGEAVKENVGGIITETEYDYVGNPIRVFYTASGGNTVNIGEYTYDFRGNMLSETNAAGDTRTVFYDDVGRKTSESDFKGNITTYTYDNAGRLLSMSVPMDADTDSVTKYDYDANGNVTKQMQTAQGAGETEQWKTVAYTYDEMNRVTDIARQVDEDTTEYTHYSYNEAGDLTDMYTGMTSKWTALMEPSSYSHTRYVYDGRGNNTGLTDSLSQEEIYTYDALGMVTSVTKRDGTVTRYTYDALGNTVSERIYADAASAEPVSEKTTEYTSTGAVRSCTLDGSTATYTYDGLGNMLSETEGETVKTYTYDDRGRKSGYTLYVNGEEKSSAVYEYDVLNRLISVTEGGKTTTYTYDGNGNRASQTIGAVTTAYTYNKANLVTDMVNTMENAAGEEVEISAFAYTYYADGNMHTKTETMLGSTSSTEYAYDGAGRLWSETAEDGTISYTYDTRGNRTHMNNAGTVTTYTYDANNRLLSETTGEETTAYTYDANGNTLTAGNKTYTYNVRGQQTGYTDGTVTASYAYNLSGLRSAKTVGGATKYFVYNGMNIVYEYDDSGETLYYYGLNRTHNSDGEIYVYNAHGDVVQLVKDNAVTVSYTYDAFGNLINTVGTSDNAFLYCGEYFDAETETYYLRARYYNPANGRFTQQDAWGYMDANDPLSLNLYTYCNNNPIMYVDPSGHAEIGLRVYAESHGALVEWNAETGYANVTFKGKTFSIKSTKKNNRDGRIYIDESILNDQFGWNSPLNIMAAQKLPPISAPNSVGELHNPDGSLKQKRWYGSDGYPIRDRDYNHPGKHQFPHDHIWEDGIRQPGVPTGKDEDSDVSEIVAEGALAVGIGYLLYRGIRMLPSLFPPLWPTIPVNVACP